MKEILIRRDYLNIYNSTNSTGDILIGINGNKIYHESISELGNILISTRTGFGKSNILRNILNTLVGDENRDIVILEEKNVEFRNVFDSNTTLFLGDRVEEGLNYVLKEFNEVLTSNKTSDRLIVIDDISNDLREKEGFLEKFKILLVGCKAIGWTVIMSSQVSPLVDCTLLNNFKTIIAARTPDENISKLFPEDQKSLEVGEAYVKIGAEFIKLNILLAKDL